MAMPLTSAVDGGVDPKAAAKEIAAAAITHARETGVIDTPADPALVTPSVDPLVNPADVTPTPPPPPTPTLPAEPGGTAPAPPADVTVTPTDAAAIAAETGVSFEEVVETLTGFGIAVETDGVPDDLRGPYGKLLEGVRSAVTPVFEQDELAKSQLQQIDAFKTRLDEKPESILLALMIDKPKAFKEVMEIAARAEEDEDYRKTVERGVELEAREAQVVAREIRHTQQQLEEKGRRAEVAVESAARRYGVDSAVADRMVAGMVEAQGADFKLSSIDGIVAQLKPRVAVPKPPPMVTPDAARAAASVPTEPAVVDTPPAPPGTTSGLDSEGGQPHRGGFLRSLIKQAGARVDKVTQ